MSGSAEPVARRRPLRLRTQLLAVVVGVALLLAVLLAVASALALRSSLLAQVDTSLRAAADRGRSAFQSTPPEPGTGVLPPGVGAPGAAGVLLPDDTASGAPARESGAVAPELPWGSDPPSLGVRGQAAGTVALELVDGEVTDAGYIDSDGVLQELTDAQAAVLSGVGTQPTWVEIPGLGTFRALAMDDLGPPRMPGSGAGAGADSGSAPAVGEGVTVVTAVPWAPSAETLRRFVLVEALVGAGALVLAAGVAALLVRRALRPLDRMARTAQRVAELPLERGDVAIHERVPDADPRTEVGAVGAALNRMLGHVESSLAARYESETMVRSFVADASHELRTPLASIRGYTELVLRRSARTGELGPETVHALERVTAESARMQSLVEDLLLLARLDAGRELALDEVDVVELAADATSDAHAASRDHVWRLDVPPEGVPPVLGDASRLRQVLVNLLGNARAHTPAGTTVTTAVRAETREGGDSAVLLTVSDDGPGIDPALLPTLFDRFTRGDSARTHGAGDGGEQPGSTGLGLAIAQAIVQGHGGSIAVESRPGSTTFTVHLPCTPPLPTPARAD